MGSGVARPLLDTLSMLAHQRFGVVVWGYEDQRRRAVVVFGIDQAGESVLFQCRRVVTLRK